VFVSTRDSTLKPGKKLMMTGTSLTDRDFTLTKKVYLMSANGSGQTRLTNDPGNDDLPLWSPLGLTILFRSES